MTTSDGSVMIELGEGDLGVRIFFDDAAVKSCGRHPDLWALRDYDGAATEEMQASRSGIVYVKLEDSDGVVGCGGRCFFFRGGGGVGGVVGKNN